MRKIKGEESRWIPAGLLFLIVMGWAAASRSQVKEFPRQELILAPDPTAKKASGRPATERVVHFPDDASLGTLFVRDLGRYRPDDFWTGWAKLADAAAARLAEIKTPGP